MEKEQNKKLSGGKKGRTWGPSSLYQKEKEKRKKEKTRLRMYSTENAVRGHARASSYPNLGAELNRVDNSSDPQIPRELSKNVLFSFVIY